jgi:hypothetical protein
MIFVGVNEESRKLLLGVGWVNSCGEEDDDDDEDKTLVGLDGVVGVLGLCSL